MKMIHDRFARLAVLGWILFTAFLNVSPLVLHGLEYRAFESVPQPFQQPPPEEPATATYTVDSSGHKLWAVTVHLSMHISDSVRLVQHIYLFGAMADWLEILDSLDTLRHLYNVAMMPFLLVFLVSARGKPIEEPSFHGFSFSMM
jgi:hypothetical protein